MPDAAFTIQIDTKTARAALEQLPSRATAAVGEALYLLGEAALTLSNVEVPVLTGYLRSTGHVDEPRRDGVLSIYVELGYGADYAFWVHEHHPTHSKFLEKALLEVIGSAEQRIAAHLRRAVERS